jgi:electron transport complex protein RnfA
MAELLLLALGASLVNHFAFTGLAGLRPGVYAKDRVAVAATMGIAVLCVLPLAAGIADAATRAVLTPFALEDLHVLVWLLVVATLSPTVDALLRSTHPARPEHPPGFVPLLAMNCAVLGVGFIRVEQRSTFFESVACGATAAAAFALVLVSFTALDERVDSSDLPRAFRGAPIALLTAGLVALAFIGLEAR